MHDLSPRPRAAAQFPAPLTYVLPLRTGPREPVDDLAPYVRRLADWIAEVLVVDGSDPADVEAHRVQFGPRARVLAPEVTTSMGKVGNVLTGVRHATHEYVVIADDDVRYRPDQLHELVARLERADVVRPQNYFAPLVWHARVDTARTLLNRAAGGDWPGTLALRRSALMRAGGYAGDVMFENLELVRTVRAAGGKESLALDLLVERRPPTTAHFARQQVRQAYDELARPWRLLTSLAVLPVVVSAVHTRRYRSLLVAATAAMFAAEVGRRRAGGRVVFPASSLLLVAPWLVWRSLCSWAALGAWVRGGVRYREVRIRRAATPARVLRRRFTARAFTAVR